MMNLPSSKPIEYGVASATGAEPQRRDGLLTDAERLRAILATQSAIASSRLDLPSLMQLIVERAQELTCADGAVVELREENEMVYRAVCGTTASFLGLRLPIDTSLSGRSVLTGEVLHCEDTETDPRVNREACRTVGARSLIVVPLRYQDTIQGVLKVLASLPSHFHEADVQTLELMAGLFGAVMNHAITFHAQQEEAAVQARALAAMREEQAQQARVFDAALSWIADYVFICDLEGRITYANRARLALWKRELKDVVGKSFFELDYPEALAARIHSQIETVIATREPLRAQAEYTGGSGMAGYYDYILVPVVNAQGEVEAVAGSTRDISEIHQAQKENERLFKTLQVERERLSELFLRAPAFIAVLRGPDHRFERVNPPYLQLVGYRDLLGKSMREAFPDVEGQGFFEILDEVYQTGQPFLGKDMRILFQEAPGAPLRERYLDFVYQPLVEADGVISGIFVHGVDLTERKQAEQALRASEERVRLASEAAGLGIWVWEPATDHVIWENARMYEIYGLSPSDAALTSAQFLAEIVHPDDADAFAQAIAMPIKTGAPLYFAGRFRRQDGEMRWIEFTGRLQPAANGQPLYVVGTASDITERKQAEHALKERTLEIENLNHRLTRSMTETHHRVKNNLQVISAMIEMQVSEHDSEGRVPLEEFVRLQAHVHTLAIVHDLLTGSIKENEDAQRISTRSVLEKLLPMLQQTAWKQEVRYSVAEVELTAKQCIALALVLNELVSNALKHGEKQAEVFFTVDGEKALLVVNDDGDGFPEGFEPQTAANTGLELVGNLVEIDLQGTIEYGNRFQGGGQVHVTFPLPANQA